VSLVLQALLNNTQVWIERVCSEDNLSDLPSREEFELLRELGATWKVCIVHGGVCPLTGEQ